MLQGTQTLFLHIAQLSSNFWG